MAELKRVQAPPRDCTNVPVELTEKTILQRKEKILSEMKRREITQLIVYGDVEHGGNFEYLTGYFTRFEEGLLVIKADGGMTLVLGNENLNKAGKARIEAAAVHASIFSLPNQPDRTDRSLKELLIEAGVEEKKKTGLAGWKLFTSKVENRGQIFDLPSFIVDTVREITGSQQLLINATDIFIGKNGVRTVNNANEIAHYEYGASLASDCVLDAMDAVECGVTEMELGGLLKRSGQHNSIVTIAASGARYVLGNMFPGRKRVQKGDPISLTTGYRGGASSRAGYAVMSAEELPENARDYLERIVFPYFDAYACWLNKIQIGMTGGELFEYIEQVLPRKQYGWSLCPGHLTAEEEWLSSPIYEGSVERLKSGMIFQIDIIPAVKGYGGVNAESTVALANEELKREIRLEDPKLWERMEKRRDYIQNELGISLSKDLLPMCGGVAYMRPFMLDKERACVITDGK